MHVGVLIKAKNKKEALDHLMDENHCFSSEFDEEGEEIEGTFNGDWDYPYDLSPYWWNGKDEDSKVISGWSAEEFKKWCKKNSHYLSKSGNIYSSWGLFDYFINEQNEVHCYPVEEDIIPEIEKGYFYFIGSVHI